MDTKLTLKLDKEVIQKAKIYAASHKRSLSAIIESYLKSLTSQRDSSLVEEIQISPFVRSMSTGKSLPADIDLKSEFQEHLEKKHQ